MEDVEALSEGRLFSYMELTILLSVLQVNDPIGLWSASLKVDSVRRWPLARDPEYADGNASPAIVKENGLGMSIQLQVIIFWNSTQTWFLIDHSDAALTRVA